MPEKAHFKKDLKIVGRVAFSSAVSCVKIFD